MFEESESDLKSQLTELAEEIAIEDEALVKLEGELKDRQRKLDELKTTLSERLIAAGLQSIKLDNGLTPKVKQKVQYFKQSHITDDDFFGWLKTNDLAGIIKPYVHFSTLQGTLKAYEEQGNVLPEMFNRVTTNTVTMYNKAKFLAERSK